MKEATPTVGKLIPPTLNKRAVNNNKAPKQTTPQETEHTPANQDKSPPKKKKPPSKPSTLESADLFVATTAGASREVSMLFSKFAEVLSERAAADTSQMKELEGILTEAQNLESYLKEKKKHLRQTLALISDKLQG
uniref:Testis expressed 12 n=1 Tax=Sander lucioperca TaxID=283035 RepID=A0A8C9Y4G9_SANLU